MRKPKPYQSEEFVYGKFTCDSEGALAVLRKPVCARVCLSVYIYRLIQFTISV